MQWNRPSRTDYYLMRIAQRIQQVLRKNPNSIKLEQQKVEFLTKGEKDKPAVDPKKATSWMKARWLGMLNSFSARKKKNKKAA